jgi:hypothetical protein
MLCWLQFRQKVVDGGEEPSPSDWKKLTTNAGIMKCAQRQADIEQVFCATNPKKSPC